MPSDASKISESDALTKTIGIHYKRISSDPEEGTLWVYFDHYSKCPGIGNEFYMLERDANCTRTGRSLLCRVIEMQCAENTSDWESVIGRKGQDPLVGIIFAIIEA